MKKTLLLLTILASSFAIKAQDTIRKKNEQIILAKVLEIGDDYILYKRHEQINGPDRRLSLVQVKEVVYSNGVIEKFNITELPTSNNGMSFTPGAINNTGTTVIIPRRGPDIKVRPGERFPQVNLTNEQKNRDHMGRTGVYFEGMIGYAQMSREMESYSYYGYYGGLEQQINSDATIGFRFGTKFFFGDEDLKLKFGLNAAWVQLNVTASYQRVAFSPASLGLASIYRFNKNTAIELNTTTGFTLSNIYRSRVGYKYGADMKLRYKAFAIGVDATRVMPWNNSSIEYSNFYTLNIGFKF